MGRQTFGIHPMNTPRTVYAKASKESLAEDELLILKKSVDRLILYERISIVARNGSQSPNPNQRTFSS